MTVLESSVRKSSTQLEAKANELAARIYAGKLVTAPGLTLALVAAKAQLGIESSIPLRKAVRADLEERWSKIELAAVNTEAMQLILQG